APGPHKFTRACELDHPVAFWVRDKYLPVFTHRDEGLIFQRLSEPGIDVPLLQWDVGHSIGAGGKGLHTLIPRVGDIDRPIAGDGHADRFIELARIEASRAELGDVIAILIEDDDALVPCVSHKDASLRIYGDAARPPEGALGLGHIGNGLPVLPPARQRDTV